VVMVVVGVRRRFKGRARVDGVVR
ncbi:DUF1523 domain-containing protein, partial [Pseudomonas syringae]|nr:DUF1523 domain-containing protein [Pseudomonas syringae]